MNIAWKQAVAGDNTSLADAAVNYCKGAGVCQFIISEYGKQLLAKKDIPLECRPALIDALCKCCLAFAQEVMVKKAKQSGVSEMLSLKLAISAEIMFKELRAVFKSKELEPNVYTNLKDHINCRAIEWCSHNLLVFSEICIKEERLGFALAALAASHNALVEQLKCADPAGRASINAELSRISDKMENLAKLNVCHAFLHLKNNVMYQKVPDAYELLSQLPPSKTIVEQKRFDLLEQHK